MTQPNGAVEGISLRIVRTAGLALFLPASVGVVSDRQLGRIGRSAGSHA